MIPIAVIKQILTLHETKKSVENNSEKIIREIASCHRHLNLAEYQYPEDMTSIIKYAKENRDKICHILSDIGYRFVTCVSNHYYVEKTTIYCGSLQ